MRKFPKIITRVLFWGLVCVPVSGFAEKNTNLPQNPNVVSGSANFNKDGNKLTINQNSDKLITNWSSFNIGKENKVEFKQPNITSTALNRVNSNDPTHIYGSLKSNGKIILINPNGVLFKDGARVDVGSIIASTLNLKDKDFINDKYVFEKNGFSGVVNNQGDIKALEGGTIAIIAPQVENKGEIETTNGTVALISGEKVKLSLNGNSLIQYSIERGVLNALIDNKQALKVDNGTIILSAKGVKEVKNAVIKNSGSLRADGITKKGGKIYLSASNGKVLNSGAIAANSQQNQGGSIRVTAENIQIDENSKISTVGKKSGGLIEIGGSWQNSNKEVFQAINTTIAEGTILDASAFDMGDGGEIVVWSNIHNSNSKTTVKGILKAEGGKIRGNGGRIETSGRALDIDEITISTKSVDGVDGHWLIDPYNITINSGSDTNISGSFSASDNDAVINVGTLETALSSSNVTVTTAGGGFQNGDITVDASITSSSSNDLTLDADRHIYINQNITRSGSGGLILEPDSNNVYGSGTINLAAGSSISTSTGTTVSPNINLSSSGDVEFTGNGTYSGSISGSGNLNKTGSGTVILSGSNSYTGSTKVDAGTLRVSSTNSVPSNHTLISNGGTYDVNSNVELAGLSGSGGISISAGRTLTLDNSSTESFSGIISGSGGFTKNGSGSFTLLNNNTHTGTTTISEGELIVKGTLSNNTNVSIASGSTYTLDNDDTVGSLSGAGTIVVPSGMTLTTNASSNSTFSGNLSGDGTFVKNGSGTLTLSGANTITGSTTIEQGYISISADNNLGTAPGTVSSSHLILNGGGLQTRANFSLDANRGINLGANNGIISTNSSTTFTYAGNIGGSGDLTKTGNGVFLLTTSNDYSGTTTISSGSLSIDNDNRLGTVPGSPTAGHLILNGGTLLANSTFALNGNRGINLNSHSTVEAADTVTFTYDGIIAGTRNLTKSGLGTFLLSGASSYSGDTNISAGTLQMTGTLADTTDVSVTSGAIYDVDTSDTIQTLRGAGSIELANSTTLTTGDTTDREISGVISGSGNLTKAGSGTLTLSGTNTFSGVTTISAGKLSISTDSGLGAAPGSATAGHLTLNGGTLESTADLTLNSNRGIALGASNGIIDVNSGTTLTYGGIMAGSGTLTKVDSGTLTLSGTNTYSGSTTISAGTISIGADSGLGAAPGSATAGHLTLNGGTLHSSADFTLNSNRGIALGTSHGTINVDGSRTLTYGGIIAGSNNLTKSGDGTLLLSGVNTYSGDTAISDGTLQTTGTLADTTDVSVSSGAIYDVDTTDTIQSLSGAGNIELASGITLTTGDSGNDTISGVISGPGNLAKAGSGTLTLSGTNTYSGTTAINAGTLNISGQLGSGTYASNISNSGLLNYTSSSDQTLSGVISGTGAITKTSSSSILTLSGTSTYSGSTTITSGTISVSSSDNLGANPGSLDADNIILNGGTLKGNASFTLGSNKGINLNSASTIQVTGSNILTYGGVISGSRGYYKTGTGTLLLSGSNTYTGNTAINGGKVQTTGTLSDQTNVSVSSGAIYDVDTSDTINSLQGSGNVELANGITLTTGDSGNDTISGVISGSGNLTKAGSGTLTLSGTNTFSGVTTISAGKLSISTDSGLGAAPGSPSAGHLTLNGGTLESTADFTLNSNRGIALGASNGIIDVNSGTTLTYGGIMAGSGTLTKVDSGTLTLSGTNTYSGSTTISAGTISIGADSGLGAAPGSATAGHLTLNGGTLHSSADFTLNSNRGIALGTSHGTINVDGSRTLTYGGIIAGSNNLTKSGDGTLLLSGVNTYSGDTTISAGTLKVSGLLGSGSYSGNISNSGTFEYSSSSDQTLSGVISGSGDIDKGDSGTLILSGNNTYSQMTMNDGYIVISADSGLGAPPGTATPGHLTFNGGVLRTTASFTLNSNRGINLLSNGTILTDPGTILTYGGIIAGSGNLLKDGTGTLVLSGNSTNTGSVGINSGTLRISSENNLGSVPGSFDADKLMFNDGTLNITSSVILNSNSGVSYTGTNANFDINNGTILTINGIVSGGGAMTKLGTGNLTLSGVNTYTASTTINAGTISISTDSGLGAAPGSASAGHLTLNGGTLESTADLTLNSNRGIALGASNGIIDVNSGTTLTYGGIMAGSGTLTKVDSGTLTLSGTNTYSGSTTISAGTISIGADSGLGAAPGSATAGHLTLNGGTLHSSADFTLNSNRGIALGTSHGTINVDGSRTLTYGGIIAGSNNLTKSGDGTLLLSGVNTYSGDTAISDGTFQTTGTLADTTDVSVSSGAIYDVDATDTIQSLSGAGNIELASGITLTTGDSGNDTISGVISGPGNLAKAGSGTLTLSGTNTYSGSTTISAGTISIGADSGLGAAPGSATAGHLTLNGGTLQSTADFTLNANRGVALGSSHGTFNVDSGTTLTVASIVAGSNNLTKSGDGTLLLSGVNTYSGDTTISAGTLKVLGLLGSGSYSGNISNSGTFEYSSSSDQTLSGVISGSGNLLKDGSGELILSGTNTYVGSTTLSAGSIRISADSGLGSAPGSATSDHLVLSNGGILKTTATFTLNSNRGVTLASGTGYFKPSSSSELTYSGIIAGSGNLKSSHGTLILNGINTFTGTTLVRSGTLIISSDRGLGTAPGTATSDHLMINGGELKTTTTFTLNSNRGILLGTHDGFVNVDSGTTLSYGGIIDGTSSGDLIKNGAGILTLSGVNTYTASTTINAGTISISTDSGLGAAPGSPSAGHLTLNGGTLESTADLTLNSNRGIALGASNGIIDVNSGTTLTYGGIMAGSGTLTKVDSGTLTLSGTNTYSGSTTISAGTISIGADSGLGAAPGSATAGHLTLNGGTLHSSADFTLNSNRGIALGTSHGTINVDGSRTLTYGGIIAGSNNLTKSGDGTLLLSGVNTYSGDTAISDGTFQTTGTLADTTDVSVSSGAIYDVDATDTIQSLSGAGNIELASGSTLTTGDSGNDTISGVISGSGNLAKAGSGTLTLSGTNTYSGSTTISAGTISIGADSGLGAAPGSATAGHLTLNGGTLHSSADFTLNSNRGIALGTSHGTFNVDGSRTLTYGGIIAGSGSFTKIGNGILILTSQLSTYSGGTINNAGTLRLAATSIGSLGSATSGPIGTGSLTNNAILDVDGNLIHNTKTNNGTIINKPAPSTSFASTSVTAIYGDSITNSFTTDSNGTKTFTSSNTSSATINSSNGSVIIVAVGNTTMSVNLAETNEYASANDNYTLTINPKTLTASASASNKVYDGLTTATTTLTFSGLVGSETLGQTVASTFSDKNVGTGKTVTVNSITLADGSNGGLAANYTISTGQTTTANITVKSLTVSGITASNKTYDSTTSATLGTGAVSYGGIVSGDDFTGSYSGVFADANVGTGKTVNITSSYAGADVSNYNITDQTSTTANITAKALTATASASNKVYDGSSAATATLSLSGFIGSETVTSTNSSTFNNKNVGTGKTVTVNSITLANGSNGGLAANYSISTGQTTTANITAKSLTASASASNKVYDGLTTATTTLTFSGLVGSETLGQTVASTFSDKNVGTGKTVTVNSITLADGSNGGLAANYTISTGQTTTANITVKSLTVSGITASNKTYDSTTSATLGTGAVSYGGIVSGDDFTGSYSGVFADANVGTGKTVNITSSYAGADVSNYNITDQTSTTANITAKALTATASASNKVYDGSSAATATLSLSGFIGSETVTSTNSSTFNNKNVGTGKTVTVNSITLANGSNGGLAANYSISAGQTTTADITAKSLTVSGITASNKTYNGNAVATLNTGSVAYSGLVDGDTFNGTYTGAFSDKNVGTGKTVTITPSYTGADVSNYSITNHANVTANITARSLSVSGVTASDKTYDGSVTATMNSSSAVYSGFVSGDDFAASYSGVFSDKNVGSGKTVTITSSYAGADVSNYNITDQTSTTANITAKALTATASASNKVYDGSSAATATLSLSGFIGSETVTSTNSSTFNNKNVGTGKTVTVNSITLANGSNGGLAANYSISTGQTTTANITAKSLTVSGITASNKTYNGNAVATLNTGSVAYSGLVDGDTFNGTYTGAFSDKNVGTGKTVTITPSYTGADVSNYSITNHANVTANITARSLSVSGVTASDKTYDGSVTATMNSSSAVYSGFVSGDDFAASYSGVFSDKNVGSGKTVTITSSYAGADVSNYNITDQTSTTADINTQVLLLSTFSASDKAYDGNNSPSITSAVSGFVGSETVNHSVTATFEDKNVGSNKVVTANSITLADGTNGGLATNYSISTGQTTTANIIAKTLTATASASNKVYDGLTTATTTLTFSGLIGSETLDQTVLSTFNNKNVGTGKTVTVNSITIADGTNGGLAGNYSIGPGQTTTANITAKSLTVSGITASSKTYDGSTSATLDPSLVVYSGLVTGDTFDGTYTGVFSNANVGTGKTINITSSYSGADVNNYSVTDQSSTTAHITAKALTATASGSNKTYDGGTIASTTLTFTGLVGSETLGQTVGSTFDNKNVGSNKTVTVNSIILADGTNGGLAANYSISAGQTTTANITAKSLTVSNVSASNKTYDGTTTASMDGTSAVYSGLVDGDTFDGTYTGAFSDKNVGVGKTVTITSSYSGADVSNYSVTDQSSTTANITAKSLTVSGITASDKTYDGSTSATLTGTAVYSGLVSGDIFTGSYTGAFSDKNVGTGKTVNITPSYSGADVNNYSVTDQSSTTADISAKALTATASASNKTYDGGTTASTTLTFTGLVGSETLGQTVGSTFDNKNVGTGKTVTVNSITLADDSGLAANYSISAGQTTTADITAKALTVSGITASNKMYDGNTVATLSSSNVTYSGIVSGDSFAGSFSGSFSDKHIGTGKTVTITSSYSGSDVSNYTVTDQSSTTANITSRDLEVTGITVFGLTVNNKEYDGTVTAPLKTDNISYSGLVEGDDFTGSYSGVFANANVGNGKTVTITSSYSGADAGNYTVTDQSTTTGNIVPKVLTATASASNKTYNATNSASVILTLSGLIGSETLGSTNTSTFNNKNAGTGKTVTVNSITLANGSNGGLAANYSISAGQTTTANITPKALTVSGITASNRTYDGSTNVTLTGTAVYSGLVDGDTFDGTYTGAFSDKNVGVGKTVTITSSYSGADVSNYSVTDQSSTTANITAKSLTVSGITASDKTYDGSTSATLTGTAVYSGLVSGDIFTGSYTGVFSNANVGTGKTVTITPSYSGADVNNYSVTDQSSTTANITAKALTATASASNKTYDGGTTASTTLTFTGLVGSETLGQTVGSTFDNKNVGSNKTVTVNSITLANGSNGGLAANYSISAGQTTTANITAKSLTVSGITASNKIYDGNTVATLNTGLVAYSGLVDGDTFNGTYTGAFSDKNVGTGKTVTITPSYSGADVSNYSITNHADVTANITAKSLTVSGVTASDKTYDGSVTATMNSSSAVYSGFVNGDDFAASYSGVFANANVGSGKTVTITSSYAGADVSNYNITDQTSTTANITAKALTATATASNKVYNSSSAATVTLSLSGFIGSETVTSTNSSTFDNKNVGTGKTVTVNSITLANGSNGGLAANYSISAGQTTTANITPKALTVSGITASNKVYDSTITATTTLTFSGLIGSETITNTTSSTFNNKNVGSGKTVTVNSITLVDGGNGGLASNYSISSGQTTTANVSARPLTISNILASNKSYDGTTAVTLDTSNVSYNGLVSGDDFSGSFSGVFANENIGTGRVVNITSSYSGDDIGNYSITNQNTHFANITIGNPTISGLSNQEKTFTSSSYTLAGRPSISGLPIVYSSSDNSIATVNSVTGEVTFVNVGTATISANILSTLNYNSATSSYILKINLNATNINNITSNAINSSSTLNNLFLSSKNPNLGTIKINNGGNINAKIVVIEDNSIANVEAIYNENTIGNKITRDFKDDKEKEKFDKPGKVIDEKTFILKISETNSYNYKLEYRQKGLVIKPLNENSGNFLEESTQIVIDAAITRATQIVGFLKNEIKTIIIDFSKSFL